MRGSALTIPTPARSLLGVRALYPINRAGEWKLAKKQGLGVVTKPARGHTHTRVLLLVPY
jgi:hypothetical protein